MRDVRVATVDIAALPGGSSALVRELHGSAQSEGASHIVISSLAQEELLTAFDSGAYHFDFPKRGGWLAISPADMLTAVRLARLIRKTAPTLVHLNFSPQHQPGAVLACALAGIPCVCTHRGQLQTGRLPMPSEPEPAGLWGAFAPPSAASSRAVMSPVVNR